LADWNAVVRYFRLRLKVDRLAGVSHMFGWDMVISKFIFTFPQIDLIKKQEVSQAEGKAELFTFDMAVLGSRLS